MKQFLLSAITGHPGLVIMRKADKIYWLKLQIPRVSEFQIFGVRRVSLTGANYPLRTGHWSLCPPGVPQHSPVVTKYRGAHDDGHRQ